MALIPASVVSVNEFFIWMKVPYTLPVQISSFFAIVFIIFVFFFGFIAVRYIGTISSTGEISAKMNPGNYLIWEKLEKIEQRVEKLYEKNKEDSGNR